MEYNYRCPFYYFLNANYWDTQTELVSKYNSAIEKNNEDKKVRLSGLVLLNEINRNKYLKFLSYNYAFSQPYDLEMLQENFSSFIFPYYIFSIKLSTEKQKVFFLILKYTKRQVIIKFKGTTLHTFEFNPELQKEDLKAIIYSKAEENQFELYQNNTSVKFTAEIPRQSELISLLLYQFQSNVSEYKLLNDDRYIPSGIILKNVISKEHAKLRVNSKRFMVLGSGQLMFFSDETMTILRNIFPLIPYDITIDFKVKDLMMKISLVDRIQVIIFKSIDTFSVWQCTIMDIMNKKAVESIGDCLKKVLNGTGQKEALKEEIRETEKKIQQLKESKERLKGRYDKEKFNYEMILPMMSDNNEENNCIYDVNKEDSILSFLSNVHELDMSKEIIKKENIK